MQNPPPGPQRADGPPPPGQPAQPQPPQQGYQPPPYPQQPGYGQPAGGAGIDKRTGAVVAYVLWWVTGLVMLFAGKNDPDVKYHAAQSIIFFGSITAIEIVLDIVSAFVHVVGLVNWLVSLFGFIMWIVLLVKAWNARGERFDVPIVGGVIRPYAEQLANSVN